MLDLSQLPDELRSDEAYLFHSLKSAARLQIAIPDDLRNRLIEVLSSLFAQSKETLPDNCRLFRARVHGFGQERAFEPTQMGAPPAEKASAGRVQLAGDPVLYTATEIETAVAEVRPSVGSILTIAEFCPRAGEALNVLNLTKYEALAPGDDPDSLMARMHRVSKAMRFSEREFSKQAHPNDPDKYLDTIFVAQVIREAGFDGVAYRSLLNAGGVNYAFFSPERLECKVPLTVRRVKSVRVESIPDDVRHQANPTPTK